MVGRGVATFLTNRRLLCVHLEARTRWIQRAEASAREEHNFFALPVLSRGFLRFSLPNFSEPLSFQALLQFFSFVIAHQALRGLFGRTFVRMRRDDGEMCSAGYGPGQAAPDPIHNGAKAAAVPRMRGVVNECFVYATTEAIVSVRSPRVKFPFVGYGNIVVTPANDFLDNYLSAAKTVNKGRLGRNRSFSLPQLPMESRSLEIFAADQRS
mmetsp:Transcript_44779/g.136662  ORF Transcript_44779/g.136662 Transcript_44779/m.136662 type:complete len:211 (+) Transcript_44779:514-1146(+)